MKIFLVLKGIKQKDEEVLLNGDKFLYFESSTNLKTKLNEFKETGMYQDLFSNEDTFILEESH